MNGNWIKDLLLFLVIELSIEKLIDFHYLGILIQINLIWIYFNKRDDFILFFGL